MPPRKRQAKSTAAPLSDIYHDLVSEVLIEEASKAPAQPQTPPRKRRRVGERTTDDESVKSAASTSPSRTQLQIEATLSSRDGGAQTKQQIVYEDFQDEETYDDDSDAEFEDVLPTDFDPSLESKPVLHDLQLNLKDDRPSRTLSVARRKALTAADRKLRLDIHKMHVLALLQHLRIRSKWCNDETVQTTLQRLLPQSVRKLFRDDETQTQWQRSRLLKTGLEKAGEVFRDHFKVSARGLSRCYWLEGSPETQSISLPEDADLPVTKEDFVEAASTKSGSRDTGAQLFCALLRSLGLDVRLVCSLQPLPLQASFRPPTPAKSAPVVVPFHDTRTGMGSSSTMTRSAFVVNGSANSVPPGVRRFGQTAVPNPSSRGIAAATTVVPKRKKIRESPYPIYWVEVFNIADQKWIPVDPLVLHIVDKPAKLEPPGNDLENSMSYVLAVDEDGYIVDVTRRYVHAYNAKTRRNRVEAARDGRQWWKRVMRCYRDPLPQDRDQLEDIELAGKENREPMPRNIIEFKNHPYYALERHLHRNEVLHPRRQVGTVSAGINKALEPIYRRADVHLVRSPDAWFRQGRQIKLGEEPLKFLEPKKGHGRGRAADEEDGDEFEMAGMHTGTPLFAAYQTQHYDPPPILGGIVPKNMYGNIDVYTTSMVPAGGVWVNHPFASGAAKLLMVDYADAVTGFEFKGRTGTAVIKGIVIAAEYHAAVVETIEAFRHASEEEAISKRTAHVLYTWKRFLLALRIRERVKSIHVEGEEIELAAQEAQEVSGSDYDENDTSGGFLMGQDQDNSDTDPMMPNMPNFAPMDAEPTSKASGDASVPILSIWGKALPELQTVPMEAFEQEEAYLAGQEYGAGGFMIEDHLTGVHKNGCIDVDSDANMAGGFFPATEDQMEGGFVPAGDTGIETAGGFIPEDKDIPVSGPGIASNSATQLQAEKPGITTTDFEHLPQQETLAIETKAGLVSTTPHHNSPQSESEPELDPDPDPELIQKADNDKPVAGRNPALTREHSNTSLQSTTNSLLSHDPEDDDVELEWL